MDIAAVMDDAAEAMKAIPSLEGRCFAHPVENMTPPSGVVPFPEISFDKTMRRGTDEITINLVVLVAKAFDRSARDRVVAYLDGSGGESVKEALEAHQWKACDSIRVRAAAVQPYAVGGVDYWAVVFPTEFVGSGTN